MQKILRSLVCSVLTFTLIASTQAYSAGGGGGGGGGAPSQSGPSFDPVEKYQEGLFHLKEKRYKKAQRALKKVLSVTKRDANTNYYLGIAYFADGKYKKARRPFERTIKYNKNNVLAVGYLGAVYMQINKPEKADEQRRKLDALKASCDSCLNENEINKSLGLIDNAASQPQASLNIEINNAELGDDAYLVAVEKINQGNYHSALASLADSAKSFGPHPDVLTYQGFANRKLGNYDIALSYYKQALAIDDNHRGANEYLGEYFVEIGDLASANKQLDKLEQICHFGCEEAEELRRWIAAAES